MARTKILVVDDDKKTVELVKLYLEKDGYRVLAAYEGWQALELARQKRPDLMILDLMLQQSAHHHAHSQDHRGGQAHWAGPGG